MSRARRSSRGFSLIEVLAALFIASVAVAAALGLFSNALRSSGKSSSHTRALAHASSMIEEALAVPEPSELPRRVDFPSGMVGTLDVRRLDGDRQAGLDEITVTITWPPSGSLALSARRAWSRDE